MTEEARVRRTVEVLLSLFIGLGDPPGVARSRILAALGRVFDGRLRRKDIARKNVVGGKSEDWYVSTEGWFVVAAGEHGVNLHSPAAQARWSCWVRGELERLVGELAAGRWRPCVTVERARDLRAT